MSELANLPGGERILAYFAAFNTHDDGVMRKYFAENLSDSVLAMRSIDDRIVIYHRMVSDIGKMEIVRVLESEPEAISVLAQSPSGLWYELNFKIEAQSPNRILGMRIEHADSPDADNDKTPLPEPAVLDSLNIELQKLTDDNAFSGTVLISRHGNPIFQSAFGLADREHNVPNRIDTKHNIGSIGKVFTQTAIERLISEGKLSYTDLLGKYLPDYPNVHAREKITIRQLLDHQSGLGDFFNSEYAETPKDKFRTLQDYLPLFADNPLLFEPGSGEQYSNGGYIVLGLIIEKIMGISYYDYIQEIIFDPIGMTETGWFESDEIVSNRAVGYTHHWNADENTSPELRSNIHSKPGRGSSAGGCYSTANDLLKFMNARESGKFPGHVGESIGLQGGLPGSNAALELGLPQGYSVIVLCNLDPPVAANAADMIREWLRRSAK